jgi:hypothetical protein
MYPTTDEHAAPGISISPFLAYDDSMIVDDYALVIANANGVAEDAGPRIQISSGSMGINRAVDKPLQIVDSSSRYEIAH